MQRRAVHGEDDALAGVELAASRDGRPDGDASWPDELTVPVVPSSGKDRGNRSGHHQLVVKVVAI